MAVIHGSTATRTSTALSNYREQLDWGAQLDIDDVNGYGPENITVDQPNRFDYLVGAHYFTARPTNGGVRETIATLRVYLYGLLSCEVDALMQDTGVVGGCADHHRERWPLQ